MPLPTRRDHEDLRRRLAAWLATKLAAGTRPEVSQLTVPEGTGMSSETLLFDARWHEPDGPRAASFVARLAPDMDDYPVFPTYDLDSQHRCLRFVAERSDVPVPKAPWLELDAAPLGAPFFVMERVEGQAPSDMPPYVFGGWVAELAPAERRRLQREAIGVLARLHAIDVSDPDAAFLDRPEWGTTPLDQHLAYQRWYYEWAREGTTYPLIEAALEWLEAHRPPDEGPVALHWGDSRIGNILWRDLEPVAVLDWEMAALGNPVADLAWMRFLHVFFQDMATRYGMTGLPDLFELGSTIADYEELSGRRVRDFEYYEMFAALRFAIISVRTSVRNIAYGQADKPADPDDLIMHRALVERMLDGSYWS